MSTDETGRKASARLLFTQRRVTLYSERYTRNWSNQELSDTLSVTDTCDRHTGRGQYPDNNGDPNDTCTNMMARKK